jgi:hypothetical protein
MRTYEPIQSGPASHDRTDDAFYVLPGALDAAAARHADRFDCDDLKDVLEDHAHLMLEAVKSGDAAAVGALIIAAYKERIEDLAALSIN